MPTSKARRWPRGRPEASDADGDVHLPESGKPVPTGVETDEQSFDTLVGAIKGRGRANNVQCPHCGKTHRWSSGGAYLAAASPL
jgi:hypothetical protein